MSQIRNYTVQEFQNLANLSTDQTNIRISQNNQNLSNTPLGFFAKIFKQTNSNIEANRAFMRTITQDPYYQEVATKLQRTLSTMLPEKQPLTAAKVKTALLTADQILKTHQQAKTTANTLVELQIIPNHLKQEFASFFIRYQKKHPEIKIVLNDFGDKSLLSPAQRQLSLADQQKAMAEIDQERLTTLSDLLKTFYSHNNRLARSKLYNFNAADCQNNAENA